MTNRELKKLMPTYVALSTRKLKELLCGKLLGMGVSRKVYQFKLNRLCVVKVDYGRSFDNVLEYHIWMNTPKGKDKYLAPCMWLSRNGKILIQRKVNFKGKYPKRIPHYFNDLKYQNYGWIGKKFVSCDYSRSKLLTHSRLVGVEWWDGVHNIKGIKIQT